MANRILDLGAQDPELRNSPIAEEGDEDTEALRETMPGAPMCYFNGSAYSHGTIIKSGTTALRCEHGLWVRAGPGDPDNP
jgi:hypothetical protein